MTWQNYVNADGSLESLGLHAAKVLRTFPVSRGRGNAESSCPASNIKIIGLGGFGGRLVTRLAFELRPSLEKVKSEPSFIALDSDKNSLPSGDVPLVYSEVVNRADSVLQSVGRLSAKSLVVLIAGIGGATGTALILRAAQQIKRTGALTVVVVSVDRSEPLPSDTLEKQLAQLQEDSDVVFAIRQTAPLQPLDADASVRERARLLLNAERWMLQCVTGLLHTAILPARTTLGVNEIRSILAGARWAGYGVAHGRIGREAGEIGQKAIERAVASQEGAGYGDLRSALIVISGPASQLRWSNVQAARNEIQSLLGQTVSCLFGVQATEHSGYSNVTIQIWLAFS